MENIDFNSPDVEVAVEKTMVKMLWDLCFNTHGKDNTVITSSSSITDNDRQMLISELEQLVAELKAGTGQDVVGLRINIARKIESESRTGIQHFDFGAGNQFASAAIYLTQKLHGRSLVNDCLPDLIKLAEQSAEVNSAQHVPGNTTIN
jgi:hypothetical protein